jgi:hypothetical protein
MKTLDLSRWEGRGQVWDAGACARPPSVPTMPEGVILTRGDTGCNAWERQGTPGNTLNFLYEAETPNKDEEKMTARTNLAGRIGPEIFRVLSGNLRLSFAYLSPRKGRGFASFALFRVGTSLFGFFDWGNHLNRGATGLHKQQPDKLKLGLQTRVSRVSARLCPDMPAYARICSLEHFLRVAPAGRLGGSDLVIRSKSKIMIKTETAPVCARLRCEAPVRASLAEG